MTHVKDSKGTDPERRGFLKWLGRGFLALWAPAAALAGASFLKAPEENDRRPGERLLRCGTFSSLAVGEARLVRHGAEPIFVVRLGESKVLAVSAICTHVRCVLQWNRENATYRCPCHDGAFDKTGNVLSGPPKRPLPQYPAEIRSDEIIVHL
jgi:cytochrome b6-f complex iron-sulfur subunit